MEKEGYVYQCKVCTDGRLYNGVWALKSGVPDPLPENVIVFAEFPSNTNGGSDYLWDGKQLHYSPAEKPAEVTAPAVHIADNGAEVTYS